MDQPFAPDNEPTTDEERLGLAVKKWLKRIDREKDEHEDFRDQAEKAWDAASMDDDDGVERVYPLMWSVAQIEHSAVYSGSPSPDARSRSQDADQSRKDAATVIQRALEFYLSHSTFDDDIDRTVDDYLIAGLGVPRIKVDAEVVEVDVIDPMTGGPQVDDDGKPMKEETIGHQMLRVEHVPWSRFGWEPCSNWAHCDWVYFEHHLMPSEIRRRWPDAEVAAEGSVGAKKGKERKAGRTQPQVVYEIWDRRNREVLVICEGSDLPLEVNDDPLGLSDFFPCPQPLMLNVESEDLIPVPDYEFIEGLDAEINRLVRRASAITEQIKAASLHDSNLIEIEDFRTITDGQSIPVDHLAERMEGGPDLRKVMYFWPNEERVATLAQINQQLILKRQQVDDLLGIADILRGSTNPQDGQETQKIKERWAGIRLKRKQKAVAKMVRDLFRIMAELTVEHVTPENLSAMTQMNVTPEIMAILQSDIQREFSVDVETDSTVAKDEFHDKMARTDLLTSLTGYAQHIAPAVAQNMIPADLANEMLRVAVDPYRKYSRSFDTILESMPGTQQQLMNANQQAQQQAQQIEQLNQQLQQMTYALQQYSQAEEARKDAESQGKVAKDMSQAQSTMAGLTDEQMQAGETRASTILKLAQAQKAQADAARPTVIQPPAGGNGVQ